MLVQPVHAQHAAPAADRSSTSSSTSIAALVLVDLAAHHGAAAGQIALAADALVVRVCSAIDVVGGELPGQVAWRARASRFLRKSARIFFFLAMGASVAVQPERVNT